MPRIAVNVADLTLLRQDVGSFNTVALLLGDFFSEGSPTVEPNSRWDSSAVVLDGPAAQNPERLEAVVELLQTVLGPRKIGRRVRCYREGPRGGWSEIRTTPTPRPAAADGSGAVNPEIKRDYPDYGGRYG
jgi:hypothetical protein